MVIVPPAGGGGEENITDSFFLPFFSGGISLPCMSSTSKFCLAFIAWGFPKGLETAHDFNCQFTACCGGFGLIK